MRKDLEYGDITMVQRMAAARGMGRKKQGYSYDYIKRCLSPNDVRTNKDIIALHQELVKLRTPVKAKRK
jgi:hypothetical protein